MHHLYFRGVSAPGLTDARCCDDAGERQRAGRG